MEFESTYSIISAVGALPGNTKLQRKDSSNLFDVLVSYPEINQIDYVRKIQYGCIAENQSLYMYMDVEFRFHKVGSELNQ